MNFLLILANFVLQDDAGLFAIGGTFFTASCCGLIIFLIGVAGLWKVFQKAGEPGWAAIIPIYNVYVILKIVGREWWWLILIIILPILFIIPAIDLAKSFGKDALYGIILLWLFSIIGFLLLGFGDAEYLGPSAK